MGQPGYGVLGIALSTKMKVCALRELRFQEGETDNKQINARNNVCVVSYCHKPWNKTKQQRRQGECSVKTFIVNRMVWDRLIINVHS